MLTRKDLEQLQEISPFRSQRLFMDFLPRGYSMTSISSVGHKNAIVDLKVLLGTLITIYDDFADRPDSVNPRLLKILYSLPFRSIVTDLNSLSQMELAVVDLVQSLFGRLKKGLSELPQYDALMPLFEFDLKQFFLANHYCEMLTQNPFLKNQLENKLYLHHNMGIVMAGMIDLMSLKLFNFKELGECRSVFLLAQRAGRISNVLTTFQRELQDGDITNEMNDSAEAVDLTFELNEIFSKLLNFQNIKSFSVLEYRNGIMSLHDLHDNLKEVI